MTVKKEMDAIISQYFEGLFASDYLTNFDDASQRVRGTGNG